MSMNFELARTQMVNQQVRAWEVLDPAVLAVLSSVPREQFGPPRYRNLAFADTAIPLPGGQVMMTVTSVVAAEGKTRTSTFKGKNEKGEDVNNVVVYEKQ